MRTCPREIGIYYYHGDHLGSSNVITDRRGRSYEHIEYFPYGETWVDEQRNQTNLPYRFTGKELDPETGMYYYGARYYEPRISMWISADPILKNYMPKRTDKELSGDEWNPERDLPGRGGVYNPKNIHLYGYVHQNPLIIIDPDGNKIQVTGSDEDKHIILETLGNIAGTELEMDEEGFVSGDFKSPEKFKEVEGWLKEVIEDKKTIKIEFGDALLDSGGVFDRAKGIVTLDYAFRQESQDTFFYKGELKGWKQFFLGSRESHDYTREGILSHELLGHGLDYARNKSGDNQVDAIKRANVVRDLLGIPRRDPYYR